MAERRSAGNALGQSYCMLNERAAIEFQKRCLASPYRYDIHPSAHIHDAQYYVVKDDVHIVKWVNDNLIECMRWSDLPELKHDTVKMSSKLELYWPNWAYSHAVPNTADESSIKEIANKAKIKQHD